MKKSGKLAILSISLLTIMTSAAISPALSTIQSHFFDVDEIYIKMIITIPAIFIIPVTLLTGKLIFIFKKKTLLITGALLYVIGGVSGGYANTIWALLAFRSLLGIGVGLLLPLARGLIADFFSGEERTEMMGYATSFNNFGGIVAFIVAGFLSVYSWRYPFFIYSLGLLVIYMVIFHLPSQEIKEKSNAKIEVNKNVWVIGFGMFYLMLMFYAIPAVLSIYIDEVNLGTTFTTGILMSIVTFGSLIFGIIFQKVKIRLKGLTSIVGLAFITLGMFITAAVPNIYALGFAMLIIGFGLGIVSPMLYLLATTESKAKDATFALAMMSSFSFLGQFISPLVLTFLQNVFNQNNPNSPFVISTVIGMIGIIAVIINKKIRIFKEHNLN